jgi:uncharacterized protein (DUF2147 family)
MAGTSAAPILTLLAGVYAASTAPALSAEMNGVWLRDDGNARVRIAPCGDKICATNLWIKDRSKGEEPGDQLVMTLSRKSPTTFSGSAFDPKRDRTYAITVQMSDEALVTRGCVLAGLLCRDVHWARLSP